VSATATVSLKPPAFNQANIDNPPIACDPNTRTVAGQVQTVPGATAALGGAINSIDPDFKFPQFLKTSLGYDRRLGQNLIASFEGLYTKTIYDVFYTNRALREQPVGVDARGRVLYGTFGASGGSPTFVPGGRTQVLNIENTAKGYAYNLTGKLERQFANRYAASLAYTFSRARDVASTANSTAGSNFGLGRSVTDTLTKHTLAPSRFEQPHRIVATASYAFPTNTDVSFIYTGGSGFNYDFSYGGTGSFGDANADGQRNDLVYVPLSAFDPTEIRFSGNQAAQQAQAAALESYIQRTPCLNAARGGFLTRNACRTPWTNTLNMRLEQSLPVIRGQRLSLRGEVFNFLNLLNKEWGEQPLVFTGGSDFLLTEVQKVNPVTNAPLTGNVTNSQAVGVYTFDVNRTRFNSDNLGSNYQVQFSLRYSF
jgi:hypothetical protein